MTRTTWVYPSDGSEPYELGTREPSHSGAYVMPDIQPYKSMITGEMITSRSSHRAHLKQHGKIEVGNEMPKQQTARRDDNIRRDLHRVISGYGH